MRYMTRATGAALILFSLQGAASAKGMTIAQLQSLMKDLGYTIRSDNKTYVSIDDQGKWNVSVTVYPRDDGNSVAMFTDLGNLPDGKNIVVPYVDLLQANELSPFAFAIAKDSDDKLAIYQEAYLDASLVNKQMMRRTLDAWLVKIDSTEPIWGQGHWVAASPPVVPTAAAAAAAAAAAPVPAAAPSVVPAVPAACDAAVEKGPLTLKTAVLAADDTSKDGDIHKRSDATYKLGEPFQLFIEPVGYVCTHLGDQYQAKFTVDMQMTYEGRVVMDRKEMMKSDFLSDQPMKIVDLNLKADISGLVPGDFTIKMIVFDRIGNRQADAVIPVTIKP